MSPVRIQPSESNVSAVVIDISKGFNKQDRNIISYVIDKGKGLILVLNKWDKIEKDGFTLNNIKKNYKKIQKDMKKNKLPTNKEFIDKFIKLIDDFD